MDDQLKSFLESWKFARGETLEILDSLDDGKLQFKPEGDKWQVLFHQFGCLGRTQKVYTMAMESGVMDVSMFGSTQLPSKDSFQSKKDIKDFLDRADEEWLKVIADKGQVKDYLVKWPGFSHSVIASITDLISHERLHQGQLISYFTLAGFELPPKFKRNWAL